MQSSADAGSSVPAGSIVVVPVIVVAMIIVMMAAIPVLVVVVPVILVLRPIAGFVFGRPDEVHRTVAGVVLVAVLTPVAGVSGRDVQIDRRHGWRPHHDGRRLHDHRLGVDHGRGGRLPITTRP